MNYPIHRLLGTLRGLIRIHPRYEDLLAYRDEELGRFGRWRVGSHLCRCLACRREAALIEEDLRVFARMDPLFCARDFLDLPKGLGKLHKAVEDWEALNLPDDETRQLDRTDGELAQQLATELDFYLGKPATAAFLLKVGSGAIGCPRVLVEAESLLGDFLGPSAASAVTRRIFQVQALRGMQGDLTI